LSNHEQAAKRSAARCKSLRLSDKYGSTRIPQLKVKPDEAQAFRSEVYGSLPPGEVASTGAMSAAVSHLETECRAA
jgi:hypothetical protein